MNTIKPGASALYLALMAWHKKKGPATLTRAEIVQLSGFSKPGTISDYLGTLEQAGWIRKSARGKGATRVIKIEFILPGRMPAAGEVFEETAL